MWTPDPSASSLSSLQFFPVTTTAPAAPVSVALALRPPPPLAFAAVWSSSLAEVEVEDEWSAPCADLLWRMRRGRKLTWITGKFTAKSISLTLGVYLILGREIILVRGLVKFVPVVAYRFCLNLPASFLQPCTSMNFRPSTSQDASDHMNWPPITVHVLTSFLHGIEDDSVLEVLVPRHRPTQSRLLLPECNKYKPNMNLFTSNVISTGCKFWLVKTSGVSNRPRYGMPGDNASLSQPQLYVCRPSGEFPFLLTRRIRFLHKSSIHRHRFQCNLSCCIVHDKLPGDSSQTEHGIPRGGRVHLRRDDPVPLAEFSSY